MLLQSVNVLPLITFPDDFTEMVSLSPARQRSMRLRSMRALIRRLLSRIDSPTWIAVKFFPLLLSCR
jgi:hypothetical protein